MAKGLPVEEQLKFFSDLFSGYRTTIAEIRKLSPEEQMSDEISDDDTCPIAMLLSKVERNYDKDTPVTVLEYLFNGLIGIEEYHQSETERLQNKKEKDYLGFENDAFLGWIFDAGKEVIQIWNDKADYDVRQRILDIGAKRCQPGILNWFYFQSYIYEAFDEEDAYDIPEPSGDTAEESDEEQEEGRGEGEVEEGEVKAEEKKEEEVKTEKEKESQSQDKQEDGNEPPSKRARLQ